MTFGGLLTYFFAAIWLVNGFCKVLDLVPRHRVIVTRILGENNATFLTRSIGAAEIVMAIWILSGVQSRINAITQIGVVAAMNVIEVFLAPDLLLWGRANAVVATLFILLIAYKEFILG